MFLGYLLDPLHHELGDLFEMTKKLVSNVDTYLFPVLTFCGLMSSALNAPKKSSIGLAE